MSLSERESPWRALLECLKARGMHGTELIIRDAHSGFKAARKAVSPSMKWPHCSIHLQQNAQSHVPKLSMHRPVAAKSHAIFNAENRHEDLTVFDYPKPDHKKRRKCVTKLVTTHTC